MIQAPIDLNSREAEAYRTLRTTIGSMRIPEEHRALLFTSARQTEGKSTTAANFAVACAASERPTLLIDADLRRPRQHEVFRVSNSEGLSGLLEGDIGPIDVRGATRPTAVSHLDVIPAGPPVQNPSELLGRPSMRELLEAARDLYDWIVLDSPPVLPVTDALVLAGLVDGVVLIVDFKRTRLRMARKAREALRSVRAPLLGVVVNQVKPGDGVAGTESYTRPAA